jgi:DNA helicase II / ATP-dependent DNA helicase PcrA
MNRLTLAVAGGRKTQGIVDDCAEADAADRILVLTYTVANQEELSARLARHRPLAAAVDVQGWFSFLLSHWVRPYLPWLFPGRVLQGLNFEGDAGQYATGQTRFLDDKGRAYKRHLARLATQVEAASDGAVLDRLSRIYDRIWIDEVQDLNGYDLVVLERLMESRIELEMVGDVRQAILQTNVRDPKYQQYKGVEIKRWFDLHAKEGRLKIEHHSTTWRCNSAIATFADRIFDASWDFTPTTSRNETTTGHDGLFAVAPEHAEAYVQMFRPLCLRYSAASGRGLDLPLTNIAMAKGLENDRLLLVLTNTMKEFICSGKALAAGTACSLYVAVTRARASVALLAERPEELGLPVWTP